jgi:hypothetical protein
MEKEGKLELVATLKLKIMMSFTAWWTFSTATLNLTT